MNKNIKVQLVNGNQDNLFPNAYYDHLGSVIHDGLVNESDRTKWNGYNAKITNNTEKIESHISNEDIHLSDAEKELLEGLPEILDTLYQKIYPVGCVYSSVNNTTPTFEGTTWESISQLSTPTVYRWKRVR